jgi:hypothetical protein
MGCADQRQAPWRGVTSNTCLWATANPTGAPQWVRIRPAPPPHRNEPTAPPAQVKRARM